VGVEQIRQRAAPDQVHGEDDEVVLGRPARRGDDMRMPDPHRLLVDEAQQQSRVVPAEELGRHPGSGTQVTGTPDRAHPADPDLVGQDVATGHWAGPPETGDEERHPATVGPAGDAPGRFPQAAAPLLA
jgi:hypothetical protein